MLINILEMFIFSVRLRPFHFRQDLCVDFNSEWPQAGIFTMLVELKMIKKAIYSETLL